VKDFWPKKKPKKVGLRSLAEDFQPVLKAGCLTPNFRLYPNNNCCNLSFDYYETLRGYGPAEVTRWLFKDCWYKGFWGLLAFAMQMCLILVTGYAIAYHPLIYRGLSRLASMPKDTKSAAALAAFVSLICAWINWGLSLIVGAVLARAIGIEF
jgi:hypothetical protein